MANIDIHELESFPKVLKGNCASWYAVIDACDSAMVQQKVHGNAEGVRCLFLGAAKENYWRIAPHVMKLTDDSLAWINSELSGDPWGIYIKSEAGIDAVHRHLRRFTKVRTPENKIVYFRFYDPRVLIAFVESSTPEELNEFFGPIDAFGCEVDETVAVLSKNGVKIDLSSHVLAAKS